MQFAITTSIFLIPYALFLLVFLLFSYFNLYHAFKFAASSFITFAAVCLYLSGTVLILYFTWQTGSQVDWQYAINLNLPSLKFSF